MQIVLLETLDWVISAAMGEIVRDILYESEKPDPDHELIEGLKNKLVEIKDDRKAIDFKDEQAVEAMLLKYSPRSKRSD
jgi:hypothetical protein